MKETKKWAAALLAGAAAGGAAAAGLAFWNRKKHNALPAGEAEEPQAQPLEEQGGEPPHRGRPWRGGAPRGDRACGRARGGHRNQRSRGGQP